MTMKTYSIVSTLVISAAAMSASAAHAQQDSDTFEVKLNIEATCDVSAGADINVGSEISTATNLDGQSSITVNCSKTVPYTLGLVPGNSATDGAGVMSGPDSDGIPYQLLSDSSGTPWGDNGVTGTGTGAEETIPVYVSVAEANVAPGSYADTVTVTVDY